MTQPEDWAADVARVIAAEVRRYRQMRGLSAQQLADRTAELGLPMQRSVLANLESGRRTTVTVAELLVLAAALSVAPVLLVFPVGQIAEAGVLPNRSVSSWSAARWLSGLPPEPSEVDPKAYNAPIAVYLEHENLVWEHETAVEALAYYQQRAKVENGNLTVLIASTESRMRATEKRLRDLRAEIEREGLLLPDLPPYLRGSLGGGS
jgi:transcriptional regulator with XRE-family HTH domain